MGPSIFLWLQAVKRRWRYRRMRFIRLVSSMGQKRDRPDKWGAIVLLCLCSCLLGMGLSISHPHLAAFSQTQAASDEIGTVDPIPSQHQLGADLYLEACATCHIGVPPQVLPEQSWQQILDDTQHYGAQLPPLVDPNRLLIWQYVRFFSRSIEEGEAIPYKLSASRYFKALHPRVIFESSISLNQCATCHPGVDAYNFRQLTAEWDNAP